MLQLDKLQCLKIGFTAGKTMFFFFLFLFFSSFSAAQRLSNLRYANLTNLRCGRGGADFLSNGSTV